MELREERNIDSDFSAQDIQKIKNVVTEAMHTAATGKDKAELSEIQKYLDQVQKKVPVYFDDWRPGDQKVYISDIRKAKKELGWEPKVSVEDGIKKLIDWVCENKELFN